MLHLAIISIKWRFGIMNGDITIKNKKNEIISVYKPIPHNICTNIVYYCKIKTFVNGKKYATSCTLDVNDSSIFDFYYSDNSFANEFFLFAVDFSYNYLLFDSGVFRNDDFSDSGFGISCLCINKQDSSRTAIFLNWRQCRYTIELQTTKEHMIPTTNITDNWDNIFMHAIIQHSRHNLLKSYKLQPRL